MTYNQNKPEHCFSMMYAKGQKAQKNYRESIEYAFEHIWNNPSNLSETKEGSHLMAMGYDHNNDELEDRKEKLFTRMSIMMIDCDNDKKTNKDPNIITKFQEYMKGYEFWIYESASSNTQEAPYPRFRALIPLDSEIEWTQFNKKAIGHLFSMFVDDGASWFYEPTRNKFHTIKHHEGKLFPSKVLQKVIDNLRESHERKMKEIEDKNNQMKLWRLSHPEYKPKQVNVSNNDKVRHYLDTPYSKITGNGDSDHSLYRAICVCLSANDENTLEEVLNKARLERWSNNELNRKIEQARRFIRK